MPTRTRVTDCENCGGVAKTVWSDGKTRMHELRCVHCGNETSMHQNKLTHLELRHADAFEELDEVGDYHAFIDHADNLRIESTDAAFDDGPWGVVTISRSNVGYSVRAHDIQAHGEEDDWPYPHPDVGWTADTVVVGDGELDIIPLNDGDGEVILRLVDSIDISSDGATVYISP